MSSSLTCLREVELALLLWLFLSLSTFEILTLIIIKGSRVILSDTAKPGHNHLTVDRVCWRWPNQVFGIFIKDACT